MSTPPPHPLPPDGQKCFLFHFTFSAFCLLPSDDERSSDDKTGGTRRVRSRETLHFSMWIRTNLHFRRRTVALSKTRAFPTTSGQVEDF